MSEDHILISTDERVRIVTLNRPHRLNALTNDMVVDFIQALHDAEDDPDVSVILVNASGRAFCSGADLDTLVADVDRGRRRPHDDAYRPRGRQREWLQIFELRKPVVVAVHGYCLGAPVEILLHADVSIAGDDAIFGYPAVRGSGMSDSQMFIYQVGPQWTKRLLMTGESIDAETACRIGLVSEVVPADELQQHALAFAKSMCLVATPMLEAVKNVTNQAIEMMGYTTLQRIGWDEMAMAWTDPQMQEFSKRYRDQGADAALEWRDRTRD